MTPEEMAQYVEWLLSQNGYGSAPQSWQVGGGMSLPPVAPGDFNLDYQRDAMNAQQDWADLYSDPAITGGIFGAMPPNIQSTFEPLPESRRLQDALSKPGTLEYLIADHIVNTPGGSASSALSLISQARAAEGTEADTDRYAAVRDMLPKRTIDDFGEEKMVVDEDWVRDLARDMESSYFTSEAAAADPAGSGLRGTVTEADNPLRDWYREQGIPTPDLVYEGSDLATPQDRQRDEQNYVDRRMEGQRGSEALRKFNQVDPTFQFLPQGQGGTAAAAPKPMSGRGPGGSATAGLAPAAYEGQPQPYYPEGSPLDEAVRAAAGGDLDAYLNRDLNAAAPPSPPPRPTPQPQASASLLSSPPRGAASSPPWSAERSPMLRDKRAAELEALKRALKPDMNLAQRSAQGVADASYRRMIAKQLGEAGRTPYTDEMDRRAQLARYAGFGF